MQQEMKPTAEQEAVMKMSIGEAVDSFYGFAVPEDYPRSVEVYKRLGKAVAREIENGATSLQVSMAILALAGEAILRQMDALKKESVQ
jgi:hypothetical protein